MMTIINDSFTFKFIYNLYMYYNKELSISNGRMEEDLNQDDTSPSR